MSLNDSALSLPCSDKIGSVRVWTWTWQRTTRLPTQTGTKDLTNTGLAKLVLDECHNIENAESS